MAMVMKMDLGGSAYEISILLTFIIIILDDDNIIASFNGLANQPWDGVATIRYAPDDH